ncbi:hypothetical protein QIS74_04542 [Colletotrichum tabaci]|uniref:Uncharacterized protein n=1 Tax=Colletotrichum tabaci TaxID=1209068 RepID=A0AAV9TJD1_9PEZI
MCMVDAIHHKCGICHARLSKPRSRDLEQCFAALAAETPHHGTLRDTVRGPAHSDPALHPSGLEFEVLETTLTYTPTKPQYWKPRAREKSWRAEAKTQAGTNRAKRTAPGPSTAGWCDVFW